MKKEESKIVVESVEEHAFKPELGSATLRQTITSIYPSRRANSEGLFDEEDYELEGKEYASDRVTFIDVPHKFVGNIEAVQAKINANPNARIKRTLSLKPMFTQNQIAAIDKGLKTAEEIAEKQVVKNQDGEDILYNGVRQYKVNILSLNGEEDVDLRPARIEAIEAAVILDEEMAKTE